MQLLFELRQNVELQDCALHHELANLLNLPMLTVNINTLDFLLVFALVHPDFLLLSNQLLNQPVLLVDLRGTYEDHLCLLFQLGGLLLVFGLDVVNLRLLGAEAGLQSLDVVLEPLYLRLSIFWLSAWECLRVHFRHRFSL